MVGWKRTAAGALVFVSVVARETVSIPVDDVRCRRFRSQTRRKRTRPRGVLCRTNVIDDDRETPGIIHPSGARR